MTDPIQIMSPQASINRARFAGKDFFTFIDDIVARIQILFITEYNDFVASGTGQMLIDIVAWAAETLSFYIDRQATESYLATARTRRAVNRLTRQLGYKMSGSVSSSTDLSVRLTAIYAFNVTIPVGFKFKGPNDLVFEAVEQVVFPAGEGPLSPARTVSVREGVSRTEIFVSDGSKNQVFRLSPGEKLSVATGSVVVRVNGVVWTLVDIITFDQTNQVEIDYNSDPPLVRFGDSVAGNVPASGLEVRVEYVANSGKSGLVQSSTITDVVAKLVVLFQQIPLTVTNQNPTSGGSDAESLESAKSNAPRFYKARNVAVTREDYEGLSQAYVDPIAGAVAVAQAFVARGASDDLQLQILIANIRGIVAPVADDITAEVVSARAQRLAIAAESASVTTQSSNARSAFDEIVTDPHDPGATGFAIDARTAARAVRVAANDASVSADEGLASGTLGGKDSSFNDIKTKLAGVEALVTTIVSSIGSIEDSVEDGVAALDSIDASVVIIDANLASMLTTLAAIEDTITVDFEDAISDQLDAIYTHVDGFLSADCKSNLIQVPILTRDVDGFLTEPSIALMRSLQRYLEARKEVTQVVEVVSGGPFLVRAIIEGTIGVRDGYIQQTVLSNVRKALDDLLRVRKFGKSLRVSDLYASIVPDPSTGSGGVVGIAYAVFKITGPSLYLDSNGNLVIDLKLVVTKGSVTLSAETAVA